MADVFIFPGEPTTSDIRLRPAAAAPEILLAFTRPIRMRRASQIILMRR